MAEKKGIRVNALAKELGVESKAILHKLKEEGLGDAAPNHMSVISLGLAESVREWFVHAGGGGTAVETAAPVEVATKPRTARSRTRKKAETSEEGEDHGGGTLTAEAPVEKPARPSRKAPPAPVVTETPVQVPEVGQPVVEETSEVVTPAPVQTPQVPAVAAEAPAAPEAPPAAPVAPPEAPKIAAEAPAAPPAPAGRCRGDWPT